MGKWGKGGPQFSQFLKSNQLKKKKNLVSQKRVFGEKKGFFKALIPVYGKEPGKIGKEN